MSEIIRSPRVEEADYLHAHSLVEGNMNFLLLNFEEFSASYSLAPLDFISSSTSYMSQPSDFEIQAPIWNIIPLMNVGVINYSQT